MKRPSVVTIVQARSASTRLPGKVLLPLGRATVLEQLVARVARAARSGQVVVATTTDARDEAIWRVCRASGIRCYRGHPFDLLDRHYQVARMLDAAYVVKIPSDCPLIDPAIIDRVLGFYLDWAEQYDYVSNLHPPTYPDGNDVEVCAFRALETAWHEATRPLEREHTTPFLWDQPERFRVANVAWEGGRDRSLSHRVVLDYPEDYEVIRRIWDALNGDARAFDVHAVVEYLDAHPEVAELNARYRGVNWYRHHLAELRTVRDRDTRFAPEEVAP